MGPFTTYRKPILKAAYEDGWKIAKAGEHRHTRPNYLTHEERQAFDCGFDEYCTYYGPTVTY